ncbi:TetR/AcrR family transcriptional regulator [Egicoccus halophilus]|uniref:TetR family transcriptional regulator n=1 Tax=Egicoccus halophilus TaxID=1670830 RepID=A0A8J3ETX4_9ACTN|nr:TetR/AcrR family transcriptional regulator [Egicoccus halophilus]GGI04773.1 TetR family transcriptional regulator [Egicoccus halophilus]
MPRPSMRPRLLSAAARVVRRAGAGALTLDAVAGEAGSSKGGVLYHFPTKAALVTGLVDEVLDVFEAEVDRRAAQDEDPAAWARAYVDATFDVAVSQPDLAVALLAVSDRDTDVMARCARRMADWHDRLLASGLSDSTAALVRFACDGWWTVGAIDGVARQGSVDHLRARLHALVDEDAPR